MSAKAKSRLTPEQRKATLRRVLEKIRPYSFFVVCSLIVAAVSVAAQLYIPILCGSAIDLMLGKGTVDFAGVMRIVVQIVVVAVIAAFAQWLLSVCNNRITFSVSRDLRNAALRKIQTLPLSYLDSHPSGDIVSRMVADVDTFADGLLMGFTQMFSGLLTIFGTLLFMLKENVPITLVVVCITPLSLVVASFLAKRSYIACPPPGSPSGLPFFQEGHAVFGTGTVFVQHGIVQLGAVTLVLGELILGILLIQHIGHIPVTADLGQNGGRRDGSGMTVALHDAAVGHGDGGMLSAVTVAVDEGHVRLQGQSIDSQLHGLHPGGENVGGVDLRGADTGHRPCKCRGGNHVVQRFPLLFRQLFGIVQTLDQALTGQDHRRRVYRAHQRPRSGLVHAADRLAALRPRFLFICPKLHRRSSQ